MSGYDEALKAAGAEVLAFENFGSYQGDWWAKVRVNGKLGWVHGYFGSCSHCDAFESEFGWRDDEKADYPERLKKFGAGYLEEMVDHATALRTARKDATWDRDADDMVKFIQQHADPAEAMG